ncbi:putative transcriptional regulator, TetR family (fragment) [Bradyrhizobium sp. STM 3809]
MSVMASSGADRQALAQVAMVAIKAIEDQSVRAPVPAN